MNVTECLLYLLSPKVVLEVKKSVCLCADVRVGCHRLLVACLDRNRAGEFVRLFVLLGQEEVQAAAGCRHGAGIVQAVQHFRSC